MEFLVGVLEHEVEAVLLGCIVEVEAIEVVAVDLHVKAQHVVTYWVLKLHQVQLGLRKVSYWIA